MHADDQAYIERSLNIKLGDSNREGAVILAGITQLGLTELINNKFTAVEWQDPNRPDCGNNDGLLYVYLPATDDCAELFLALDLTNNFLYVS